LAVHFDGAFFLIYFVPETTGGIETSFGGAFTGIPFVLVEAVEVVGVDDGEFAAREGDFAVWIAGTEAAVQ
jgi:hypothetical protein